jgi:NADPH-dependent curcumin reductase CurA
VKNRRIVLASRPTGVPVPENFAIDEVSIRELAEGEVLMENLVFAIDPATRNMLDDLEGYMPAVALGGLIPTMAMGRVVASRNPGFHEGDYARGYTGWESHSILEPANITIERVHVEEDIPLTAYMGAVGWSGITAYVGLKAIGAMTESETVLVSAAAGAVGSVVGQVARLRGNRAIGIAGGAAKAALVESLGMEAIDHRATPDLEAKLREMAPQGINIYFDNVGGAVLDATLPAMADFGRIVVCGMVANYNNAGAPYPIRNLWQVLVHRITMRGFLAFEHKELLEEAEAALTGWVRSGELTALENVSTGLEATPAAFIRLMSGETTGKTVVRLSDLVSCLDPAA